MAKALTVGDLKRIISDYPDHIPVAIVPPGLTPWPGSDVMALAIEVEDNRVYITTFDEDEPADDPAVDGMGNPLDGGPL